MRTGWHDLLREPPAGAHLILWTDGSPSGDRAMAAFVRGAMERDDLCVVVLPEKTLASLRGSLLEEGVNFAALEAEARVLSTTPERLGLRERKDATRIPEILKDLRWLARDCGRAGVSILVRLTSGFFEGEREEVAEAIEQAIRDHAGPARILCAYRSRGTEKKRTADAATLIGFHTYALTAHGEDRFFVEPVGSRAGA